MELFMNTVMDFYVHCYGIHDDLTASYHGCKEYMENNLTRTWCIDKIDEICFEYTNANDIFYIARQSCLKYVQQKMKELVTLFPQNTQLTTKRKRDFGVTSIILGISLLVLGSTTIYTYLISNPKTKDEIIEEFMTTSTEIQKSLQKNLMTTANELSELKVRVMKLEHLTFENSFRSSDISFKINHLIQIMREIKNSIESQSTLPPSMFRYFNITLHCGDSCPLNTISEAKCNLLKDETGKWFLRFQFKILNTETELKLQKADPFTLIQQQNETICLKKYQGPEFIIINKTSNELCEIESKETEQKYLIHFPSFCSSPANIGNWKLEGCVEATKYKLKKPQIKIVNDYFLIYCVGHNITMFGQEKPCPENILKVSMRMNFTIDNISYTINHFAQLEHFVVTPLSNIINWKIMSYDVPNIPLEVINFSVLENITKKYNKAITETWFDQLRNGLVTILLSVITLCIALMVISKLISSIFYCIKRPVVAVNIVSDRENTQRPYSTNIPLSTLY